MLVEIEFTILEKANFMNCRIAARIVYEGSKKGGKR